METSRDGVAEAEAGSGAPAPEVDLSEHTAFFEKVWQHTSDPMFVLRRQESELVVDAVNPALARRLGRVRGDLTGRPATALMPPPLAAELDRQAELALSPPLLPVSFETRGLDPGRRSVWKVLLVPVSGAIKEPRLYGIARDVTHVRRTREALRRGLRRLDQRLRERTRELHELATRDPLTHAYNRRHFFELATRQCALARRHGEPLSAVMLDVDHFKSINDTFGHAIGDRALEAVADCCRRDLRASDLFGRYGGEEFAILLPETPFGSAVSVAEKIRRSVAGARLDTERGTVQVTVSIGVASCTAENGDLRRLLDQADQALLRAKRAGRNRVEAQP